MACTLCDLHQDKSKGSLLPSGWTRVYVTVKKQKTDAMDIRTRAATFVRMVQDFCPDCANKVVYSKLDSENQKLTLSVSI